MRNTTTIDLRFLLFLPLAFDFAALVLFRYGERLSALYNPATHIRTTVTRSEHKWKQLWRHDE
jgi:hypothetical protein